MKRPIENSVFSYVIPYTATIATATYATRIETRAYGVRIFSAKTSPKNFSTSP